MFIFTKSTMPLDPHPSAKTEKKKLSKDTLDELLDLAYIGLNNMSDWTGEEQRDARKAIIELESYLQYPTEKPNID